MDCRCASAWRQAGDSSGSRTAAFLFADLLKSRPGSAAYALRGKTPKLTSALSHTRYDQDRTKVEPPAPAVHSPEKGIHKLPQGFILENEAQEGGEGQRKASAQLGVRPRQRLLAGFGVDNDDVSSAVAAAVIRDVPVIGPVVLRKKRNELEGGNPILMAKSSPRGDHGHDLVVSM